MSADESRDVVPDAYPVKPCPNAERVGHGCLNRDRLNPLLPENIEYHGGPAVTITCLQPRLSGHHFLEQAVGDPANLEPTPRLQAPKRTRAKFLGGVKADRSVLCEATYCIVLEGAVLR